MPAQSAPTYMFGRISNVSLVGDMVFITLDTGLPDNCAGTPFGWMVVPASYKTMAAFVIGLRLSGNLRETNVVVYTTGRDGPGYCQIDQIDPAD
jgi:hypothetical protein